MEKILFPMLAAAMLTACTHQTAQTEKDKHKLWDWKEIHHYMELSGDCFEASG